ncbi:DUF257 family protein [Thermococcus sp. 2319x1]|uniref:DUF257 family protein n=1 Tax=Thermococcus sp. 2319x1 TaxID=1674923 RepID=UPI001583BED4|nr:DUF257 family protein [Thermococcus sp. 2319x1]
MQPPAVNIWEKTKFGETVLLEYNSIGFPSFGLYSLVSWAKKKGYKVVVTDVLDTLKIYMEHARLSGLDGNIYQDVKVIKLGGRLEVGNVLKRIPISEESVMEKEIAKLLDDLLSKGSVVNIVVGVGKLFALYSSSVRDALSLANFILSFVGDERRKAFYFLNLDMIEKAKPMILPMFEEFATTVVRVNKRGSVLQFKVLKALNFELDGFEGEVDVKDGMKLLKESQSRD